MKSTTQIASAGLAAATLSLGIMSPGAAATSTTYHGYYDGVTTYTPFAAGDTACPSTTHLTVSGVWNVRIAGDRATMSTNLFYGGEHHLAYGGAALDRFDVVSPAPAGTRFQITGDTYGEDSTPVTVTLTLRESGQLTYEVAPYPLFGYDCASLTLTGHEGTPATQ
jgi:hypothetical protein